MLHVTIQNVKMNTEINKQLPTYSKLYFIEFELLYIFEL